MRKFLAVAAVAVLALAVAVPAMALDFKFGGEYRVRFYSYINAGFTEDPGSAPRGAQVRIRPRFDASDDNGNITATLRLEIGDIEFGNGGGAHGVANGFNTVGGIGSTNTQRVVTQGGDRTCNGCGGSLGNDGINVETKWAYIDAAFPFGVPLRVRAGIQPWYLPKGMLVDDDVAGVRFYGTTNPVSYEVSWYRTAGSPTLASTAPDGQNQYDNNFDFYNGKFDLAFAKWLNAGLYAGYGRNAASVTNNTGAAAITAANSIGGGEVKTWLYAGLSFTGDLGFMKYDFDFVTGRANGLVPVNGSCGAGLPVNCIDASGYGVDVGAHIPIGPVILNLGLSFFTGDNQDGGISETMPFISPSWNGPGNMMFEMFGAGGVFDPVDLSQDYPGGTWTAGFSLEYRPVKALWMRLGYLYQRFTQNDSNCALLQSSRCFGPVYNRLAFDQSGNVIKKTSLGHEVGLRADWDVWTGFKVQTQAGFWIPSSGDVAMEFALQMLYNF